MTIFNFLILSSLVPYYYDKNIHNLGNTGLGGFFHGFLYPIATKIIDFKAYNSVNIREEIYNNLDGKILDLCCGAGFSTKKGNFGIDTSREMLTFAKIYNRGSTYEFGNAETFGEYKNYDITTCFFSFHEMPSYAHRNIISNAMRITKNKIIIVDISTDYKPSKLMLAGEPYVEDYIQSIDSTQKNFNKTIVIPGHVDMWEFNL